MTVHPTRSLWAIADRTEAAVRSGRADFVRENVAEADVAAQSYRSSYLTALVERSKALLADPEEAADHYERALQAGRLSESPLELARTQLLFGEWLRRERRSVDARLHLRDALQEFDSSGARVFADRAASELRAAGGAPDRKADASNPATERLTPQELQVAQLAARGLSNKEIADRIYLSHRTVSTHLYKVFPKLAITGRAQLQKALAQAGYKS
jgi:DNA-binding CsgD family transcriptional regulator